MKLLVRALTKFLVGLLFVGLLLFLPAGGCSYPNGWLFIALLFGPMTVLGIVLFLRAPALLAKRLDAKETERTQRGVVALSGL
ncbi:MAG: isoprenylcysteine carboxylmethyltransferase family protein, partial [Clostridia bacterium]|nr:isoprenylcysteine carboxylmethyltransferase family protein [Clostridia bacterium]